MGERNHLFSPPLAPFAYPRQQAAVANFRVGWKEDIAAYMVTAMSAKPDYESASVTASFNGRES
jgi:hypothetical protein